MFEVGTEAEVERRASALLAVQGGGEALDRARDILGQAGGFGLCKFAARRALVAAERKQSRKLEPGALCSGLLGEQVAQHRNGAGEVVVFLSERRDPETGLGAQLWVRILGKRLEHLLGAGSISLSKQPVGKIEQLRGACLLAIRLAGAGVGCRGRRLLNSRRQRRDGADKDEHHRVSAHMARKKQRLRSNLRS